MYGVFEAGSRYEAPTLLGYVDSPDEFTRHLDTVAKDDPDRHRYVIEDVSYRIADSNVAAGKYTFVVTVATRHKHDGKVRLWSEVYIVRPVRKFQLHVTE